MGSVAWARSAVRDLDGTPDAIRAAIVERVGLLADFPAMGAPMDGPYAGYRQLVVRRHRVIYRIDGDQVRIAYVRHGARQLGLRVVRDDDER